MFNIGKFNFGAPVKSQAQNKDLINRALEQKKIYPHLSITEILQAIIKAEDKRHG